MKKIEEIKQLENKLMKKYYQVQWKKQNVDPDIEDLLLEQIYILTRYRRKLEEEK